MSLNQTTFRQYKLNYWFGLTLCAFLAITFRSLSVGTRSFDCDEMYELRHLSFDILEIARDVDGFPPLFRWFLSIWVAVSGEELSRLICVAFGVGTVVGCSLLARKIGGDLVGMNTALFSAISAHQVSLGQSLRAYSMYCFAVALTMLSGWILSQNGSKRNWIVFLLCSFFAIGSHYYSVFFLAAIWIFVLTKQRREQLPVFGLCTLIFMVMCVPWLMCLRFDLSEPLPPEWVNRFGISGLGYMYLSFIQGKAIGPSQTEILELARVEGILAIAPWAAVGFTFTCILVMHGIRKFGLRSSGWLLVTVLVLPLVVGIATQLLETNFASRYVSALSVPFAILVGCGFCWRGRLLPVVATYGLIALNLLSTFNRSFVEKYDRENYRQLIAKISEYGNRPAVIVLSHYMGPAVRRELNNNALFCEIGLGTAEPFDWPEKLHRFAEQLGERERIFVVVEWLKDPSDLLQSRDSLLSMIDGKQIQRISNTIDLFVGSSTILRKSLKNRPEK